MFRMKNCASLLLILFCQAALTQERPLPAAEAKSQAATGDLPEPYPLARLVDRARERSHLLQAAEARVDERRLGAIQARTRPNPELSLALGPKWVGPEVGALYELAVSQPLLYPGKFKLRGEAADLEAESAQLQRAEVELSLTYEVVRLAYEYSILQRRQELAEQRQERFQLVQSYLAGRLFPSPQKRAETQAVENRLCNLAVERLQIQTERQAAWAKLNFYLGWEEDPQPGIRVPWLKGNRPLPLRELEGLAEQRNLSLAIQQAQVRIAEKEKALAEKERKPDFSLSAFYGQETAGETETAAGVGFTLPLPLLNRNQGNILAAEKRLRAEDQLLRYQQQQLESLLKQARVQFEGARQAAGRYPEALLSRLDQELQESEKEFRKGRVELLTFLELEAEAAETKERALAAQSELSNQLITILFLAGEPDPVAWLDRY